MSNVYARPFVPSEWPMDAVEAPKVLTINPAVQVSSGTSLSDRFSQLYQKRRQNMVPNYQAQQTTARYTNAMTRRTGEAPSHELQQEVFSAAYNQRAAPFYPPAGPQPGQRRGGYQGGYGGGFQPQGPYQPEAAIADDAPAPAPPQRRPSQGPPAPRSWHVVRGGALQPQGPVHTNRPTAPPPPQWGPPGGGPGGFHGAPRGGFVRRGSGRGGRGGGYRPPADRAAALDADLDAYMRGDAKTGAAALDADLDAWRRQGEAERAPAAPGPRFAGPAALAGTPLAGGMAGQGVKAEAGDAQMAE